jgi:DNA topoisomerase-3
MTCVLGMVVRREREIRAFQKTPFYRVMMKQSLQGVTLTGEWKAVEGSAYYQSPKLYKENGFLERADAQALIDRLMNTTPQAATVCSVEKKRETKNAPLLFNLAELQNTCSKFFKISPDQTLQIIQELYEKKLVTYPRTDARVLSTAVAKEIHKNISGLQNIPGVRRFAEEILANGSYKNIAKTRYTNDKQITDHYAVIPTGQGMGALKSLGELPMKVYEVIVRRFLAIFYPSAVYQKVSLVTMIGREQFFTGFKVLKDIGYLAVMDYSFFKNKKSSAEDEKEENQDDEQEISDSHLLELVAGLKKGAELPICGYEIKEGETSPPKRYTSGSMVLAMENAGQLIEDEELRAQIKGSGIGTSATRAEIIAKLVKNKYLALNKKTQVITPTQLGEMIFDVVNVSIRSLLNPELTASWEKGLTYVAEGSITEDEYMVKLENFIRSRTAGVMGTDNQYALRQYFDAAAVYYKTPAKSARGRSETKKTNTRKSNKGET